MLSVDFLEDALKNNDNCIIITHHIPSESLIDIKYKTRKMLPYNQWFYCDLDNLIKLNKNKIKYWIYGHTHMASIKIIDEIQFLCNPIGYPNENFTIDLNKTIII
jgi:predicted phosphodiesterase